MGTPRKINAILLNIKINQRELSNMCRYKLATYWQNFMEIYSTRVKILQNVLGGATFFDSHCRPKMSVNIVAHCSSSLLLSAITNLPCSTVSLR